MTTKIVNKRLKIKARRKKKVFNQCRCKGKPSTTYSQVKRCKGILETKKFHQEFTFGDLLDLEEGHAKNILKYFSKIDEELKERSEFLLECGCPFVDEINRM